jgi:hypothetical protein
MSTMILAALALAFGLAMAAPADAFPGMTGGRGSAATEREAAPTVVPDDERAVVPDRLVGRVLALDPVHGRVLLGTAAGVIALRADPADVAQLEVGDVIAVQVEEQESEEAPGLRT